MVIKKCIECKEKTLIYAKGKCKRCYSRIFIRERIARMGDMERKKLREKTRKFSFKSMRKLRARRYFNLTLEEYEQIISQGCMVCGFKHIVDLHHRDKDKKNNNKNNLVPLCPNHHKMVHAGMLTL